MQVIYYINDVCRNDKLFLNLKKFQISSPEFFLHLIKYK